MGSKASRFPGSQGLDCEHGAIAARGGYCRPAAGSATIPDRSRDAGRLIVAIGVADAVIFRLVVRPTPYYWSGIVLAIVLFTGGYLVLDRRGQWLHRMVVQARPAAAPVAIRRHLGLAKDAGLILVAYGVLTAIVSLLAARGSLDQGSIAAILPGALIAQGILELVHAQQLRSWEWDRAARLLVALSWRRRPPRGYILVESGRP